MSQEIDYLAKVCANIIKAQGLSVSDMVHVAAKITNIVYGDDKYEKKDETPSHQVSKTAPVVKPVEDNRPKRVIAKAGTDLFCGECAKPVFKLATDVTDPMAYQDFVAAYIPIGHGSKMGPTTEIAEMMVDCPLCHAEKTVPLVASEV